MPPMPRSRLVAYAAGALLVVLVGVWSLRGAAALSGTANGSSGRAGEARDGRAADPVATTSGDVSVEAPAVAPPVVHVAGAVRHGGVYRLRAGSRVQDAVRRAGGATHDANLDGINLAAKVADGQQIVVPTTVASAPAGAVAGDDGAGTQTAPAAPVGLNAATLEQLQTLDGVGPATAQKIVAWRTEHGGFRSVDDLGQVPGIGPKRLAALRDHVQP